MNATSARSWCRVAKRSLPDLIYFTYYGDIDAVEGDSQDVNDL